MTDDGKGTYIVLGYNGKPSETESYPQWSELESVKARSADAAIRDVAERYDGFAVFWAVPRRSAQKMSARVKTTRRVVVEDAT